MSTDMMTYLDYISTWEEETDDNIWKLIDEHRISVGLDDFDSDTAVDGEFNTLSDLAMQVRNLTISADAIQIAADAAAVASIWSFGLGMAVFAILETDEIIEKALISSKSKDLNDKLKTVDTDISAKVNPDVNNYVVAYKANNTLIASKAPAGLDTRACRSILLQFLAHVHMLNKGQLTAAQVKEYAHSARILYNSSEITKVYDALDVLNLSAKTDADSQKYIDFLKGFTYPEGGQLGLTIVRNLSIVIMGYKLNIANKQIQRNAEEAGFEVEEVNSSAFGMLDSMGKFFAVVAVVMAVVDTVLEILDIVDVVEQCKSMCDQLDGPIKASYKAYFNGIRTASQQYKVAITPYLPPGTKLFA